MVRRHVPGPLNRQRPRTYLPRKPRLLNHVSSNIPVMRTTVVLAATALLLAGCGESGNTSSPASTTTVAPSNTQATATTTVTVTASDDAPTHIPISTGTPEQDGQFIAWLKNNAAYDPISLALNTSTAQTMCAALKIGEDWDASLAASGATDKANIVRAGVHIYCPEQESKIPNG